MNRTKAVGITILVCACVACALAAPVVGLAFEIGYRSGQIDYSIGIRRWIIGPGGRPHEIAP